MSALRLASLVVKVHVPIAGVVFDCDGLLLETETRWTIDRLAEIAGTSRTKLSRSFKAATGLSPHRYIVEQRVEKALSEWITRARCCLPVPVSPVIRRGFP